MSFLTYKEIHENLSTGDYVLSEMLIDRERYSTLQGIQYIEWLIDNDLGNLPKCLFHSKNPIGRKNMEMYYNNYLKHKAKSGD